MHVEIEMGSVTTTKLFPGESIIFFIQFIIQMTAISLYKLAWKTTKWVHDWKSHYEINPNKICECYLTNDKVGLKFNFIQNGEVP